MNKKANPLYGMRAKLLSAVSMLLVAVIMVISSTYAWFTLSTAPEVKGISTAIGANGALEMALSVGTNGNLADIKEGAVSAEDMVTRNLYWGNLVDMSDASYGAGVISLLPSKLNTDVIDGVTSLPSTGILSIPKYGTDGRVTELGNDTVTGTYNGTSFFENSDYGFRGVGVASGMTERELAYRNTKATANTYMKQALAVASNSLESNGEDLANIIVAKATESGTPATYTSTDVAALLAICDALLGTDETNIDGALEYIEQAYIQYVISYAAATNAGEGIAWNALKTDAEAGKTLSEIITKIKTYSDVTLPEAITTVETKLNTTKASVTTAKSELAAITATEGIEWATLKTPLDRLANSDAMKVNGMTTSEIRADGGMDKFVNKVTADKFQVSVSMATGAGVYADIADHCGDYSASIKIDVVYGSLSLNDVTATMKTETGVDPVYLDAVAGVIPAFEAGEGDSATKPITEFYGYILDLAFRTNAADSKLLLQTAPKDRIYSDNAENNEFTWGGGSTMSFSSTTTSFGNDKVTDLMKHITVVFFDTEDHTVYATAKLDCENAVNTGSAIEAPLYLWDNEAKDFITTQADAEIVALTQNVEARISALVYLDGETITNADVAAEASSSMTGKFNLQFSSSANLVPTEYGDYHVKGETTAAEPTT